MTCNFIGYDSAPRSKLYAPFINKYSAIYKIPSEVVAGLIKAETTSWSPSQQSFDYDKTGSFGLGQFTTATRSEGKFTNYTTGNPEGQIKDIYLWLLEKKRILKLNDLSMASIWKMVRAYNGSGASSYVYLARVKTNTKWILANACAKASEPSLYEIEKAEENRIALKMAEIKKQEAIDQANERKALTIAYATHDENAIQKAEQIVENRIKNTERAKADILRQENALKRKKVIKQTTPSTSKLPITQETTRLVFQGITITLIAIVIYIYNGYIEKTTSGLETL